MRTARIPYQMYNNLTIEKIDHHSYAFSYIKCVDIIQRQVYIASVLCLLYALHILYIKDEKNFALVDSSRLMRVIQA